eukprot:EG_transcript_19649
MPGKVGGLTLAVVLLFLALSAHQVLRDHQGTMWLPSLGLGSRGPIPPQCLSLPPTDEAALEQLPTERITVQGLSFPVVRGAARNASHWLGPLLAALNHTMEGAAATLVVAVGDGLATVASLAAALGAYVVAVEPRAACGAALQQLAALSGTGDRVAICHNSVGQLQPPPGVSMAGCPALAAPPLSTPPAPNDTAAPLRLEAVLPALRRWVPPARGRLNTCIFVAADGQEPRVVAALQGAVKTGLVRHVFVQLQPGRWVNWGMTFRAAMEPFGYLFERSFPVRAVACTDPALLLEPGRGRT